MQPLVQQQPDPNQDEIAIVDDAPTAGVRPRAGRAHWKVLIVDDDREVHAATQFALGKVELQGRPLELIEANNSTEAQDALLRHPDVAVILLDVVMEAHDSGLKFARWVRDSGLHDVRIILRTGQPGYAPELDVIRDYDINDYRAKSELTQTRLITSMTAALRSFEQIETIERSRRGLGMIVSSCSQLFQKRELASFSHGVLMQIASLCGVRGDGLICALTAGADPKDTIVSGVGDLSPYIGRSLADLPDDHALKKLTVEASRRRHSFTDGPIVLSVDGLPGRRYVASLDHDEPLDSMDSALLGVFSANIAVGFENVGLIERLDRLAFWDEATTLPNRNQLLKDISEVSSNDAQLALIRVVSHTDTVVAFGQAAATELLHEIAASLMNTCEACRVYRYGEDVLATVVLPGSGQEGLLDRLGVQRFKVAGQMVGARFAVGCAVLERGLAGVEVCDRAHAAMSLAETQNLDTPVKFDASIVEGARGRIEMMAALRDALDADAISIVFQPIVELSTGALAGCEALARWDWNGKPVSPADFIPLAEQAGFTLAIFELGVRRAADLIRSRGPGATPFYVSVNLTAGDLQKADLVPYVMNLLARTQLPPARLQVEITEQSLIQDFEVSERNLAALKALGCRIAIDDFGTGYSSLSYVGRLPAHVLKLDRQFIVGLASDTSSQAIVGLMQDLARRLNLEVVAEGVETDEQQAALQEIGCRYAQGYRFGRPMEPQAFAVWLDDRR
jgi:EAL domain-containing protein (putative c-di-GMP-specific phosphodiesterase class I)/CheY-like chemotaxis protein